MGSLLRKTIRSVILASAVLMGAGFVAFAPSSASARDHWHSGVGIWLGWPSYYRPYGYWPYPYYPPLYPYPYPYPYMASPPVTVIQQPPVMVAPAPQAAPAPSAPQSYYYCTNPKGYYPYVMTCQVPWQPVPVTPQQK